LQVTEQEIVSSITMHGLRTVREVKSTTGAGDGCTCCHKEIHEILEQHQLSPCGV
jgi:NAD(P)H-nitrite reductase large subunit